MEPPWKVGEIRLEVDKVSFACCAQVIIFPGHAKQSKASAGAFIGHSTLKQTKQPFLLGDLAQSSSHRGWFRFCH